MLIEVTILSDSVNRQCDVTRHILADAELLLEFSPNAAVTSVAAAADHDTVVETNRVRRERDVSDELAAVGGPETTIL